MSFGNQPIFPQAPYNQVFNLLANTASTIDLVTVSDGHAVLVDKIIVTCATAPSGSITNLFKYNDGSLDGIVGSHVLPLTANVPANTLTSVNVPIIDDTVGGFLVASGHKLKYQNTSSSAPAVQITVFGRKLKAENPA
jgi:hypothetical protein